MASWEYRVDRGLSGELDISAHQCELMALSILHWCNILYTHVPDAGVYNTKGKYLSWGIVTTQHNLRQEITAF